MRCCTFLLKPAALSLASAARALPDRSPLTSAMNTGTPARAKPSASGCKVTVLPVPVVLEDLQHRNALLHLLAEARGAFIRIGGARHPRQIAFDIGHEYRNASTGEAFRQRLQGHGFAGAGGACDESVAIGHTQCERDLRLGVGADDKVALHFYRLLRSGFECGDVTATGRWVLAGSSKSCKTPHQIAATIRSKARAGVGQRRGPRSFLRAAQRMPTCTRQRIRTRV